MSGMAIFSEAAVQMMARPETAEDATECGLDRAVESMVREHSRFIFRIAYSVLRNHDDAEDATQEVFVRVMKNRSKLHEVREEKLWLAKITWRVTLDYKRSLAKSRPADGSEDVLEGLASGHESAEKLLSDKQMKALLEKMIATLPSDLRETLALSTVHELNSSEIAGVLAIPESSVRTRLLRARALLKQKMQVAMGESNG